MLIVLVIGGIILIGAALLLGLCVASLFLPAIIVLVGIIVLLKGAQGNQMLMVAGALLLIVGIVVWLWR